MLLDTPSQLIAVRKCNPDAQTLDGKFDLGNVTTDDHI